MTIICKKIYPDVLPCYYLEEVYCLILANAEKRKRGSSSGSTLSLYCITGVYPKNEIKTPAATAEPITPEILLAMQY